MAKEGKPLPPQSINVRGIRPTSNSPIIRTVLEPIIISVGQRAVMKRGFETRQAEWDKTYGKQGEYAQSEHGRALQEIEGHAPTQAIRDRSWWFGTPIVDELIMSYDAYTDDQGNTNPAGGIVIQNILLTVKQVKNIVRTKVPGHRGTIKQFISDGDYEIDAVGKIIAPPEGFSGTYSLNGGAKIEPRGKFVQGERPTDEIMALVRVLRAQIEVDVNSPFLNLFDIDRCVIMSHEFPQEPGKLDNQMIRFKMYSDEDFDVITGA